MPVVRERKDPILGYLKWNKEQRLWDGEVTIRSGLSVSVQFKEGEYENEESEVHWDGARRAVQRIQETEEALRKEVSSSLLSRYNESWTEAETLDDRSRDIDENEFISKISLRRILLDADGKTGHADVYYDDGNLFGGVSLVLPISLEGCRIAYLQRIDIVMGTLSSFDSIQWEGRISIHPDLQVSFSFTPEMYISAEESELEWSCVGRTLHNIRDKEETLRRAVSRNNYENYNQNWTDDSSEYLDEDEFMSKISLSHILLSGDGSSQLFYDAGDLYGSHCIIADIDDDGTFCGSSL